MSRDDERNDAGRDEQPEFDEALSALLDGELEPEAAASMRARLADEPGPAERLASFAALDGELRSLPESPASPDLAARMRERLRAEAVAPGRPTEVAAEGQGLRAIDGGRPPRTEAGPSGAGDRASGRWVAPAAAAVAAGLALFFFALDPGMPTGPADERIAPDLADRSAAPSETALQEAELLSAASDEELGIALQFETLYDLEEIEHLELLELLAALEGSGRG